MALKKLLTTSVSIAIAALFVGEAAAADVTWNVSLWGKRRAFTEHIEKLAELVSAKTNGSFEIKLHYGAALSKSRENLDGISFGAFEMAQFCASYHADKNPSITVLELPFLGVPDLETQIKLDKMIYATDVVKKDLARWNAKILMSSPMPQYNFVGRDDAPKSIKDFEGMRVRALGGVGAAMKSIGAVPTSVTASETYQALESGTVQAASFAPHAHLAFKTVEAGNWYTTNLNPGTVNCPVVANIDSFNALSDEHKQALMGSIDEAYAYYVENYAKLNTKFDAALDQYKIERITYGDDELAAFKAAAGKPNWDAWVASMKSKGIPGDELLKMVQDALAK